MTDRPLVASMCLFLVCLTLVSGAGETPAVRQQTQRSQAQRSQSRQAVSTEPVSAAAEKVALEFVRAQHPDLADLLDALRRSNQTAYQSALRDVSRDAERLNKLAERDSERHQLSLTIWNLDSRIRLEIARLSMSSDAEVESRLRPLMEARQAARIALLEFDYQRQKERFEKLNEQLISSRATSSDRVTAELERIQRLIAAKSKSRSAAASREPRTKSRKADASERQSKTKTSAESREASALKSSKNDESSQKK